MPQEFESAKQDANEENVKPTQNLLIAPPPDGAGAPEVVRPGPCKNAP